MRPLYEGMVTQPESPQVLDAEGPLDGELQWEYQLDPRGPLSDSWSMSIVAGSDAPESLEHESHRLESVAGSPVSASRDDAVSSPRTEPGSPMGDVEDTGGASWN